MNRPPPEKDKETGRFVTGNSGGGRPKGARNKLGEAFLQALHDDFAENGVEAIARTRKEKPDQYLKVIAATLPKELNVKVSEIDELSDEQIARQLASIAHQLAASGFDFGAGAGAEEGAQPAQGLPTLQ